MEIIQETLDFQLDRETVVAIGKFDGVHIGHRRLLEEILEQKKKGLTACVFTFDPPPAVFFGLEDDKELTTREEKRELFALMGVDVLIEFPMNAETAVIPAQNFVRDVLLEQMQMRFLAAGEDLSFGAKGAGNVALLREMSVSGFYEVRVIEKVRIDGEEVSSTFVRAQVEQGNMELVDKLLGAPYRIEGTVVRGNQIGTTLGFPTVNLCPPPHKLLPPNGVYYSKVFYQGRSYRAITNVGYKPTVTDKRQMGVESYLYDFDGEIYGETIAVELLAFRRREQCFADKEALKAQLAKDIAAGRVYKW